MRLRFRQGEFPAIFKVWKRPSHDRLGRVFYGCSAFLREDLYSRFMIRSNLQNCLWLFFYFAHCGDKLPKKKLCARRKLPVK